MNSKINVGLVQIGEQFGGQYYFPYSAGLLQAHAQKHLQHPENYHFLLPVYKKQPTEEITGYLQDTDIIFFSVYIWNFRISLEVAKRVKEKDPRRIIVFGGPQVPEDHHEMKTFLLSAPFIDIGTYGEGEIPFLKILENIHDRSWMNVPSIAYFKDNEYIYNAPARRLTHLDEIPSPYLAGTFDPLIRSHPEHGWSALIETNRGCPFSCAFCYWGKKGKNKINRYSLQRVYDEIDWISHNKIEFVFCCDANFGIFDRDENIIEKTRSNKDRYQYPVAFSVQNTKNSSEKIFSLQRTLNDAGLQKGVNLALQSLNQDTLTSIGRTNISNDSYRNLIMLFANAKIPTFTDLIIGLPNETYDSLTTGISQLIEWGQHNRIQFINLTVLPNTAMNDRSYIERYGLVLQETKLISHHTRRDEVAIDEYQKLVVGTSTMPMTDWVKARVFCWTVSLLHFNKLLQIVFITLNRIYHVGYRELIELFMSPDDKFESLSEIQKKFREKAAAIQNGDNEYVASSEFINLWWPIDEYTMIQLCHEGKLEQFYEEAEEQIRTYFEEKKIPLADRLLNEVIALNMSLIKLPFQKKNVTFVSHYNLPEIYDAALNNETVFLKSGEYTYTINKSESTWESWIDWARQVIWYESKKGAYIYNCSPLENGSDDR